MCGGGSETGGGGGGGARRQNPKRRNLSHLLHPQDIQNIIKQLAQNQNQPPRQLNQIVVAITNYV